MPETYQAVRDAEGVYSVKYFVELGYMWTAR